ncbi:MAG: YdeI/OmpD-associated family protein [Gemmatimonadaceae bacterium]
MPPVIPKPDTIRGFRNEAEFEKWLHANHASATEIWLKIHKKKSGLETITYHEALDVALCYGWIDGHKKSFDEQSFIQRFSPRQKRSMWSLINTDHIERLTKAGRMQPSGIGQVEMAKKDGRWDTAYSGAKDMQMPDELAAALRKRKKAQAMYATLTSQNRYALSFRLLNTKTEVARTRKVGEYIAMLERGETIHPNGAASQLKKASAATKSTTNQPSPKKAVVKKSVAKKTPAKKSASKKSSAKSGTKRTAK